MERLKALLAEQHRDLDDLTAEVQRKEITPARIIRLMKIVQRNVEICERLILVVERIHGANLETPEEGAQGFRTKLS